MRHALNNRRRGTVAHDEESVLLDLEAEDILDSLSRCAPREYVATPKPLHAPGRKAAEAVS